MKSIMLLAMLLVVGCSGSQHCLRVNGEYSGVQGAIEYCYSAPQSEKNNTPTFVSDKGNSYLISDAELAEAVKLIEQAPAKDIKPMSLPNNANLHNASALEKFRYAIHKRR